MGDVKTEETKVTKTTANDAITQAIADNKAKEEKKEEKKEEPKQEEKKETETDGLSEEEITHAKNLMLLLKNPDTSRQVVEILARQAGVIETKEDAKLASKTISQVLAEELGEDYAFLAPKLGPAIEKITKGIVEEHIKDIKEAQAASAEEKVASEVDSAFEKLGEINEDFKDYQEDIYKLMDDYPPNAKTKAVDYFTDLYNLAKARKGVNTVKKEEKISRNRNDAPSRLASGGKGSTKEGELIPTKMTLKASIEKAMEELTEK